MEILETAELNFVAFLLYLGAETIGATDGKVYEDEALVNLVDPHEELRLHKRYFFKPNGDLAGERRAADSTVVAGRPMLVSLC